MPVKLTEYDWSLTKEAESQFETALNDVLEPYFPKAPETLYHYTKTTGIVGIISSSALWSTNALFLNDRRELSHGIDLFQSELENRKESVQNDQLKQAMDFHANIGLKQIIQQGLDVYVTCFSEKDDQLSQWRAYSGNQGYTIGINSNEIEKVDADEKAFVGNPLLSKVVYNPESQVEVIRRFLVTLDNFSCQARSNPERWKAGESSIAELLFRFILRVAPVLKDPSFEEEAEWRLLSMLNAKPSLESNTLHFSTTEAGILPYVVIRTKSQKLPIRSVRCGPTTFPDDSRKAIELVLSKVSGNSCLLLTDLCAWETVLFNTT